MKKNKWLYSLILILFCIIFSPFNVNAKTRTSKQCKYYINENQLAVNDVAGTINCEFKLSDPFWIVFGKESFSYECTFNFDKNLANYKKNEMTILIENDTSEKKTDFNLEDWFRENKSCPRYLVVKKENISSKGSVFAANTNKQVDLIKKKYGTTFSPYLENSIRDKEIESDTNSDAHKKCETAKENLEKEINLLKNRRDELLSMGCQNYVLTDEEREGVASSEKIKKGRECKQITDTYGVTVASARSMLNDYLKSGCINESSNEYSQYKNTIDNFDTEVNYIDKKIDEQNGVPNIIIPDLDATGKIECEDIFKFDEVGSVGWMINTIFNYLKVIGPILVVLLSSLDFIKAVLGTDEKAMKEAQTKLIIRLVAALALFLIPTLVQVLLGFVNQVSCSLPH